MFTWRLAKPSDDDAILRLCLALYAEDPGPVPVPAEHIALTLHALREQPARGSAVVLELDGEVVGYALLVAYWSNEKGGEVCALDELYVAPAARGRQQATRLIESLAAGTAPWASKAVALALEVTPSNHRARSLYERLGFSSRNLLMSRRVAR